MTKTPQILPKPRHVVCVVPDGGQLMGIMGCFEALDTANRMRLAHDKPPLYAVSLAGLSDRVRVSSGPTLSTTPLDQIEDTHTLVMGGLPPQSEMCPTAAMLEAVQRLSSKASRVVSICTGAFTLGAVGLLDGRRCTTHWLALKPLRQRYPKAQVEADALYTEDGPIYTSAGATAGIDLALHLIRQDGGSSLALAVARALVMFTQRPGGQSQFSTALRLGPGQDEMINKVINRVLVNPAADHRVDTLAGHVGMSPRNFARVFRTQTGTTPAAFVARARVEAAQRLMLQEDATLEWVAEVCGFGTLETLRRTFIRVVGVSPGAYRARFRAPGASPLSAGDG
ncbi:MAG: GlxA family transcriptional regulator [Bradymonadia bacterium]